MVAPAPPLIIRLSHSLCAALLAISTLGGAATVWADAPAGSEPTLIVEPSAATALSTAPLSAIEQIEFALLARVNADRAAHGLELLQPDPEVVAVARTRAAAQVLLPSLSHYDPAGKVAIQNLLAGSTYNLAGENLARLRADDTEAAHQAEVALMNSPTHRKNILEPRFNRLAIGLARSPDGRLIFAQIFRAV